MDAPVDSSCTGPFCLDRYLQPCGLRSNTPYCSKHTDAGSGAGATIAHRLLCALSPPSGGRYPRAPSHLPPYVPQEVCTRFAFNASLTPDAQRLVEEFGVSLRLNQQGTPKHPDAWSW